MAWKQLSHSHFQACGVRSGVDQLGAVLKDMMSYSLRARLNGEFCVAVHRVSSAHTRI